MRYNLLTALVVVIVLSTIVQQSYIIIQVQEKTHIPIQGYAESVAYISACVNYPPENFAIDCNTTYQVGTNNSCQLSAVDQGGGNLTYSSTLISEGTDFLTTTPDGNITILTYNGTLDDPPLSEKYNHLVGNYTYLFIVDDNLFCDNSAVALYHNIEVVDSINDPPYLRTDIPNRDIPQSQEVVVFRLNDYFVEPEGDPMTFTFSGPSSILLTIWGTSDVIAFSTSCGDGTYTFTAKDPQGLSGVSNQVKIDVDCQDDTSSSSGGGGGSGGGYISGCVSQWKCNDWSRCNADGISTRTCFDLQKCNPLYYVHEMQRDCIYVSPEDCVPEWNCDAWSLCQPDGTQSRTCSDLNECNKDNETPIIKQDCIYNPTCSDNVKNQNETGVDCGGPCLPCTKIEIPGVIKEQKNILSSIMILIIFSVMSLLIVYKYFHKQINTTIAKMLLGFTKKTTKRILLSDKDKNYLLDNLLKLEKDISPTNLSKKAMKLSEISRGYFSSIFKISLTSEKSIIEQYVKQLKINDALGSVLLSFFDFIIVVETKAYRMFKTDLLIMIEELREIIHQTSNFSKEDIGKEIEEMKIGKNDNKIIAIKKQIFNTYIAMHFDEIETMKNKYSELIKQYEDLSESEKGKVYEDVQRLFNEIKYLLSSLIK